MPGITIVLNNCLILSKFLTKQVNWLIRRIFNMHIRETRVETLGIFNFKKKSMFQEGNRLFLFHMKTSIKYQAYVYQSTSPFQDPYVKRISSP
jgi:hypothetical protein